MIATSRIIYKLISQVITLRDLTGLDLESSLQIGICQTKGIPFNSAWHGEHMVHVIFGLAAIAFGVIKKKKQAPTFGRLT